MKSYAEIKDEVVALIAQSLGMDAQTITEESGIADLSKDSIQLFELLLAFERVYDTKATYEDVVRLNTVRDIIEYVSKIKYSG